MKDLSKETPENAAKRLYNGLDKMGFNPSLLNPKKAEKNGWGKAWFVLCEEAPFEGLVSLSLGGSIYAGERGYYDTEGNYRKPEFKITDADKYVAECWNNWNIGFYPNI